MENESEFNVIESPEYGQVIEYKYKSSQTSQKIRHVTICKRQIPRWIVFVLGVILVGFIALLIATVILLAIIKPNGVYGESCKTKSCLKALNLICINDICQCESPKYYKEKCIDLSKYRETCTLNTDCNTAYALSCVNSTCGCTSNFFWNEIESKCIERRSYNEDCSGDACKLNINLSCNLDSGICECVDSTKYYWNGTMCIERKSYSKSCSSDIECLIDYELTFCDGSTCNCTNKQYFDTNLSQCTNRLGENMTCNSNQMCSTPMFCSASNQCSCPTTQFYDPFNYVCIDKFLNGEYCNSDHECRGDLGLKCQGGVCSCQSPDYVWYTLGLQCKLTYSYSVCSGDSDCNPSQNLVCTSNCTCPSASGSGICDCKKEKDNEFYWDGSNCVPALVYGSACSYNYECQTITQNSFCNTTTGLCECATPGGFSTVDKVCKKCFSDEFYFDEMCYYFSSSTHTKADSKNKCDTMLIDGVNRKSDLLVVLTDSVNTFIADHVSSGVNYWISGRYDGSNYNWDLTGYGQIGTNVCNFRIGIENCLYYSGDDQCFYNDITCGTVSNYICQRKAV